MKSRSQKAALGNTARSQPRAAGRGSRNPLGHRERLSALDLLTSVEARRPDPMPETYPPRLDRARLRSSGPPGSSRCRLLLPHDGKSGADPMVPMRGWYGGGSGIRTHGTVSRTHAFQASALNHSAIPPRETRADYTAASPRDKKPKQPARLNPPTVAPFMRAGKVSRLRDFLWSDF